MMVGLMLVFILVMFCCFCDVMANADVTRAWPFAALSVPLLLWLIVAACHPKQIQDVQSLSLYEMADRYEVAP
jgi:hypothetical protein